MNRRNISSMFLFVMVALLLSMMVIASENGALYGGRANATSKGASASAWNDEDISLLARARISNLIDTANATDEQTSTSVSASITSSALSRVDEYPPTDSYATAWVGPKEVEWDSWSAS